MSENETLGRRNSDKSVDIEGMIIEEGDPKQRAFLIVLNAINISLVANTRTVREISEKLESHLDNFQAHTENEDAIMNQGRGAWKVLAWVLGIAQTVTVSVWLMSTNEIATINKNFHAHEVKAQQIESRVDSLERQTHK